MGCNSSKDGSNPSQTRADDNAPKDKPEDGNAQQTSAAQEDTPAPADDKASNGQQGQEEVQEIQDGSPLDGSHSQSKYEAPFDKGSDQRSDVKIEDINVPKENNELEPVEISRNIFNTRDHIDWYGDEDNDKMGQSPVDEIEQQPAEGGEGAQTEQQAEES